MHDSKHSRYAYHRLKKAGGGVIEGGGGAQERERRLLIERSRTVAVRGHDE